MNGFVRAGLALVLPFSIAAGEPAAEPVPPRQLEKSVESLAASLDRLAAALEKEAAGRGEDREARRIEIAIGIMALRYRKIERLENEIQGNQREAEEAARQIELMKAQNDQFRRLYRSTSGELSDESKTEIDFVELRIKSEEDRITSLRDRAGVLQNELAAERQRLTNLEAVLNAWMEEQ